MNDHHYFGLVSDASDAVACYNRRGPNVSYLHLHCTVTVLVNMRIFSDFSTVVKGLEKTLARLEQTLALGILTPRKKT